jgi:hypothetical protein
MFKRSVFFAMVMSLLVINAAVARDSTRSPDKGPEMRKFNVNAFTALKLLSFANESNDIKNTSDANMYLFSKRDNAKSNIIDYLKNADGAARREGRFDLLFLESFFAIAQDLSVQMADAILVGLDKLPGAEKPEALLLQADMRQLKSMTLKDQYGYFNWDAIELAIKVYTQSRLQLADFLDPPVPGEFYQKYLQRVAIAADVANSPDQLAKVNFQNNNGLNSDGVPNAIPAGAWSLGPLTTPLGSVIAFGDGGFPVVSGALDSHSLSSTGGLSAFSLNGGMDTGTNASPTVCSILHCFDSNTVRWGVWGVGGSATISTQAATMSANSQLHYLVGTITTPAQYATLTGVATYIPVGGTSPTGGDGRVYSATIGNVSVNFGANTATLTQYALSGHGLNTAHFTFTNVPLTVSTDISGNAKVVSGSQTNAANNTLSANGFFAGATGSHVGMGLKTTDQANTLGINQVQAFKRQ